MPSEGIPIDGQDLTQLLAIIAHRLTEPVRALIAGLKNVEQGDLSVELPVCNAGMQTTLSYYLME